MKTHILTHASFIFNSMPKRSRDEAASTERGSVFECTDVDAQLEERIESTILELCEARGHQATC